MKLEYSIYDISLSDLEIKEIINKIKIYHLDVLSVLPGYLKIIKSIVPETLRISTAIDYPLGTSDLKTRLSCIDYSIKNGTSIIDVVSSPQFLSNRKYDKFRDDIKTINEFCTNYSNIEVRYILEYRVFSYELLYKAVQILQTLGIKTILPSTGYMLDDINDNLLAAMLIKKKVENINIICNGNIWTKNQLNLIKKASLYGLRLNSPHSLDLFNKNC
jgi:deoxyribose-phosphate aldolase